MSNLPQRDQHFLSAVRKLQASAWGSPEWHAQMAAIARRGFINQGAAFDPDRAAGHRADHAAQGSRGSWEK